MRRPRQSWTADELQVMVQQYFETLLWAAGEDDDGRRYNDRFEVDDIPQLERDKAAAEVIDFYRANRRLLCAHTTPGQAGHDFLLTRNRHGAGFWDRGLNWIPADARQRAEHERFKAAMDRLTDAAHVSCAPWLYVGDDGLPHLAGHEARYVVRIHEQHLPGQGPRCRHFDYAFSLKADADEFEAAHRETWHLAGRAVSRHVE